MLLSELVIPPRINLYAKEYGMDTLRFCRNIDWYKQYPYEISYKFNSRGYRDEEWPKTLEELKDAIWCIGCSWTIGIGSPIEHTWPYILQQKTGKRVINISMNGASNDWISRMITNIHKEVNPEHIVAHWTYTGLEENSDASLNDEERKLPNRNVSYEQWHKDWMEIVSRHPYVKHVTNYRMSNPNEWQATVNEVWTNVADPLWGSPPRSVAELNSLPQEVKDELTYNHRVWDTLVEHLNRIDFMIANDFINFEKIDVNRDGFHFDVKSTTLLVDMLIEKYDF
jgi:hypothetical protein